MSPPRLTQYYPGGTAKQLLDFASDLGAGTEPTFSQSAPGGPVKQIIDYADPVVTEANPTLDQYAAGGPAGQIVNWMATAEGGGGSGYVADAVHFDGTVSFGTASLSAPSASGIVLISIWEKADSSNDGARQIFMCDGRQPGGAYASAAWIQANATPFFDIYLSDVNSNSFIGSGEYPYAQPVGWHHFLIYGDLDHADPDKIFKVYRDDVDVTFSPQVEGPAFVMTWNGKPFDIGSAGDTGSFLVGDLSNFRIIVPSSPLSDESGGLPEATRRLFISAAGKPVDPAVATAAALGTTIVNLSGDADSYAGAFTASPGSVGSLTNATTSPSD